MQALFRGRWCHVYDASVSGECGVAGERHQFARRSAGGAGNGGRGGGATSQRCVWCPRALAGGRTLALLRWQATAAQPSACRWLQAPRAALRQPYRYRRQGDTHT